MTNIAGFYLYETSEVIKLNEIENRMLIARSVEKGKMGCCPMDTEFQSCKMKEFQRSVFNNECIVNNTINLTSFKRETLGYIYLPQ